MQWFKQKTEISNGLLTLYIAGWAIGTFNSILLLVKLVSS